MRTKVQLFLMKNMCLNMCLNTFSQVNGCEVKYLKVDFHSIQVFLSPHEAFRGEVRAGKGTKKHGQNFCGISESKIKGEPKGFGGRGNEEKVLHPEGWRGSAR